LAERIGCSHIAIRKIEAGERRPSRQIAQLLAAFFNVPPGEREAFLGFARSIDPSRDVAHWSPYSVTSEHTSKQSTAGGISRLPALPAPLIGREQAVEEITLRLMQDEVRLLTLTGPPGIGKTSLALQIGHDLTRHFEDGVYFVPLAPVSGAGLLAPVIAQALGVPEIGSVPVVDSLAQYLRSKQILLVLDNLEHLLEPDPHEQELSQPTQTVTFLSQLLSTCPGLKLLLTSRELLRLQGERRFIVPPLVVPERARSSDLATLLECPSMLLFARKAQAIKPDFALNEENASTVAEICIRLEGMPLPIELAAARIALLSLREILAQLDSKLRLLVERARDLPPRQTSLRGAIDWSYHLLGPGERVLFARLSVFVGGCALSAVQAVCNAEGDLPFDVLHGLASLIDKSLLKREEVLEESRYTMLETICEYAAECLAECGEVEKMKRFHLEYYLTLAEAGEQASKGAEQMAWSERLEREHDNLRAGLGWASQSEGVEMALRLVGALGWFWEVRAHIREGQERLAEALSWARASEVGASRALAKTLNAAGRLAYRQGKVEQARSLLEENVAVCRQLNDRQSVLESLQNLGHVASHQGDFASARIYREESLVISRELGDKWAIAGALIGLGDQRVEDGDLEAASAAFEESMTLYEEIESKWGVARALNGLGDVARCRGDYRFARTIYEESLAILQQLGAKGFMDLLLHNLGHAAQHDGDLPSARRYFRESLVLFQEQAQLVGVGVCLVGLAGVASTQNARRAAVLLGAAKALLDSMGYHMDRLDRIEYNRYARDVYALLDEQSSKASYEHGQSMTVEQAIAYASMDDRSGVERSGAQSKAVRRLGPKPARQA
jgi:predicted ATPase